MWPNQYRGSRVTDVRVACTRRDEFEGYNPSWIQHIYAFARCYVHCTGNAAHMCGQCRLHVHATLSTLAGDAVGKCLGIIELHYLQLTIIAICTSGQCRRGGALVLLLTF
jgi:hypothetical protein